jgi:hypothetical protein
VRDHYDGLLNEAVEKIIHLCVDIISFSMHQNFLGPKAELEEEGFL